MQGKAFIGTILVTVALILVGLSMVMPWYRIEVDMDTFGMSLDLEVDYYLDHAESSGMGITNEISYDNETASDLDYIKTFKTTQILVFAGIVGCVLGLLGASMEMLEKLGSKLGALLVLIAVILSLIAPLYLMVTLPGSWNEGSSDDTVSSDMETDFFGSEEYGSGGSGVKISWGGSWGWAFTLVAAIMCIVAFFFVFTSTPDLIKRPSKDYSMPIEAFVGPKKKEPSEHLILPYSRETPPDIIEDQKYPDYQTYKEMQAGPIIFEPIVPQSSQTRSKRFQCPVCERIIVVSVPKRPLNLKCPKCGIAGIVE